MKRLAFVALLTCLPAFGGIVPALSGKAHAQTAADVSAKEAFEAARALGTPQAWEAFLRSFPTGFYADLARAYLQAGARSA
jgi:hypothetical protein